MSFNYAFHNHGWSQIVFINSRLAIIYIYIHRPSLLSAINTAYSKSEHVTAYPVHSYIAPHGALNNLDYLASESCKHTWKSGRSGNLPSTREDRYSRPEHHSLCSSNYTEPSDESYLWSWRVVPCGTPQYEQLCTAMSICLEGVQHQRSEGMWKTRDFSIIWQLCTPLLCYQ